MSKTVERRMIDALWPDQKGSAWYPAEGEGMDLFLDAKAQNLEEIKAFIDALADIRNPYKTTFLPDLEKEYGFPVNSIVLSEMTRRQRIAGLAFQGKTTGSPDDLQKALDDSGFDLQVHVNSPAVDPDIFLTEFFVATCGTLTSCCGNQLAYCSTIGGEWVVTGDVINQAPAYLAACGVANAVCGNTEAQAGYFEEYTQTQIEYQTPPSTAWPFVFFVGGDATRAGDGSLLTVDQGFVPIERKAELKTLIVKVKPLHSWCALIATYT
jgi:hypothetical protein